MSRTIAVVAAAAALAVGLSVDSAGAQVRQYTSPGGREDQLRSREEDLERASSEALWHLGPVRVDPALWISDLAWVKSQTELVDSDFTARAGAGLRAYLPVGSRTTVAAYALPEYIWWKERANERRINQRFGLGTFTYFNRLRLELTAEHNENFDFATAENFQRVTMREDRLALEVEVPLFSAFTVHAKGAQSKFESLAEGNELDAVFDDLNRDDTGWRAGLRYYLAEKLYFGGGGGQSKTSFAEEAEDRSNSGDFWYAEAGYDRPKLGVFLDYQQNQLRPEAGSSFGEFDDWTGGARIEWRPRQSIGLRIYDLRSLVYSLGAASSFVDERAGLGLRTRIGGRFEVDIFSETGSHEYNADLGGFGTTDDVDSYGVTLTARLGDDFNLGIAYLKSTISPPGGFPDRELEEIRGTFTFGIVGGAGSWY